MQAARTDHGARRARGGRHLRVALPARPESAGAARRAVSGLLPADVPDVLRDAVLLAVSEAVTNAVVHAYEDADGSIDLFALAVAGQLILTVEDRGRGTAAPARRPGLGMGLRLIHDVAEVAIVADGARGGTSVQCLFSLSDDADGGGPQSRRSAA